MGYFKEGDEGDQLVSHAHYADEIFTAQKLFPIEIMSKRAGRNHS